MGQRLPEILRCETRARDVPHIRRMEETRLELFQGDYRQAVSGVCRAAEEGCVRPAGVDRTVFQARRELPVFDTDLDGAGSHRARFSRRGAQAGWGGL